jgi:outer membrane protein assembly factor BamB
LGVCPSAVSAAPRKDKPAPLPTILPAEAAWTVTLPAPPSAGAAMDRQFIYAPLQSDQIVALERKSGRIAWQRAGKADWPLLVRDGVIYAAADNVIRAIDARTGEPRWEATLPRDVMGPLRVDNGLVLAMMSPDGVLAYRVSDGRLAWQHSLGGRAGTTLMTSGDDMVYLTAPEGRLIALSLADGRTRWDIRLPGTLSQPAAARDRVFVGSNDNTFYALNRSGHLEWKWRSGGDVIGADADARAVYFASLDNIVRSVNRGNGNQRWQKDTGTRPVAPPVVVGPVVVVPGVGATLSAFSTLTGAPVGSFTPPGAAEFKGDPLLDPNLLPFEVAAAILTRDGRVIALRPTGMMFREAPSAPFVQLPGRRLDRESPPFIASDESP